MRQQATIQCEWCRQQSTIKPRAPHKRFCSKRCGLLSWNNRHPNKRKYYNWQLSKRRKRLWERKHDARLRCKECRQMFNRRRLGPQPQYCSWRCSKAVYHRKNGKTIARRRRIHYRLHSERLLRWHKAHRQKPEVRTRYQIQNRLWRLTHAQRNMDYMREWRREHPDRVKFYARNRRDEERGAAGSHTFNQWERLKEHHAFRCARCKRNEPEIMLTRDHVKPISKGGSNFIRKIQPLCLSCNSSKRDKHIRY